MIVLCCNKCGSIELDQIKLEGWNRTNGTFSEERVYCNTCCNIIENNNYIYNNIDKNKLIKYMINQK